MSRIDRSLIVGSVRTMFVALVQGWPSTPSIWETRTTDEEIRGLLLYRSHPSPTTPVIVWLDGDDGCSVTVVSSSEQTQRSAPFTIRDDESLKKFLDYLGGLKIV